MNVRKPGENRNTADCYYAWRCLPATEQRAIRLIYAHKKAEQISISGGFTKVNNLFLRVPIPGMCTCECIWRDYGRHIKVHLPPLHVFCLCVYSMNENMKSYQAL